MMSDPIAAMLTTIRNANQMRYDSVTVPSSKIKVEIAKILLDEGFIVDYKISGETKKELSITLKYSASKERVISGLKRISKPGLRVNVDLESLPRVLKGLGVAIISTNKGVMSDKKARALGIGGEVLAYVW